MYLKSSFRLTMISLTLVSVFCPSPATAIDINSINQTTATSGRYAGIYNPTSDFDESVTITADNVADGALGIIGFHATDTNPHAINGDLTLNLSPSDGSLKIWALYFNEGSDLTVNGGMNMAVVTDSAQAVGVGFYGSSNSEYNSDLTITDTANISVVTNSGLAVGMGLYSSNVGKFGSDLTVNVASSTGRVMGVDLEGGSSLEVNNLKVDLNASGKVNKSGDKDDSTRWIQALFGANGTIHASGTVTLNVTSLDDQGNLVDTGDATVFHVLNLEGSAYNTNAIIEGNLTVTANTKSNDLTGIFVSGDQASTEELHANVIVGGMLNVNVKGENSNVQALLAQGESGIEANHAIVDITTPDGAQSASGLIAQTNPEEGYPGPGNIVIHDGLQVTMAGGGSLVGIISTGNYKQTGSDEERGSVINIGGFTSLNLSSSDSSATGIEIDDGAQASLEDSLVQVTAKTDAVGILLNNGNLTLNGVNELVVKGESSSTGISLENGSALGILGTTLAQAESALSVKDENSKIDVGEVNGSGASLVLAGAVDNAGTINLYSSDLQVIGEQNGNFNLGQINSQGKSTVDLGAGTYSISTFAGDGDKTLRLNDLSASVNIASVTGSVGLTASGSANDSAASPEAAANALLNAVTIESEESSGGIDRIVVEEGLVNDALTATVGADGLQDLEIKKNSKIEALGSVGILSIASWRHETNDLMKRMGELRDAPQGIGSWARIYGSEQSYGSKNLEQKSTSVQIGSDFEFGAGWKGGVAFSYTDSSSTYNAGQADGETYAFAAYGTWLDNNGQFVDLIAKYGRISTDFQLDGLNGSYDNNALSLSAEYGYRFDLNNLFFLEPQVEVTYGRVFGDDFSAGQGVSVSQDDFDSLIGRVGLRAGCFFPEQKGTVFAHFSVLNDFLGDFDASATNGIARNSMKEDLGGTWVEFGVGGSYRLAERTQGYVNMERTAGGEIDSNWQWNIGLRHVW